jgi:hypothetical protein
MPLYKVTLTVDPRLMIAIDDHLRTVVERFHAILHEHDELGGGNDLQERVVSMMHTVESTYTYVIARLGAREAAEEAIVYGRDTATVVLELPMLAATAGDSFLAMMDEADAYCRSVPGMEDVASTAEVAQYRRWVIGEVSRQLGQY